MSNVAGCRPDTGGVPTLTKAHCRCDLISDVHQATIRKPALCNTYRLVFFFFLYMSLLTVQLSPTSSTLFNSKVALTAVGYVALTCFPFEWREQNSESGRRQHSPS